LELDLDRGPEGGKIERALGGEASDDDLVLTVPGLKQGGPGARDEVAIQARTVGHGRASLGLRPKILAEVGLVPDRPETDGRKGHGLPLGGERAVVALADRVDEMPEPGRIGLPREILIVALAGQSGTLRPARRSAGERELDVQPVVGALRTTVS
jgi:hypothetical protein